MSHIFFRIDFLYHFVDFGTIFQNLISMISHQLSEGQQVVSYGQIVQEYGETIKPWPTSGCSKNVNGASFGGSAQGLLVKLTSMLFTFKTYAQY